MNPVEEDRALHGDAAGLDDERRGREAMDPTTRHLVLISSGIGLLLAVLIGGWMLSGRQPGAIPVIEAATGPVRLKPIDPGGMQAMGGAAPVGSDPGSGTLSTKPEVARPDALQAEVDAARREGAGQPLSATPATPPAASPAAPAAKPRSGQVQSERMLQTVPLPAPHAPAGHPSGAAGDRLLRTDAGTRPTGSPAAGRRFAVQLAAVGSDGAAQGEWDRLRLGHPALFSGRAPEVDQADHAGHAIYRLRTRGFDSIGEAAAFCEQAHAQGIACTVADF